MLVSETFYSIQGEGELTGVPSFFIRTSGCNLRCTWCDTKGSSWQAEGEDIAIDQIVEQAAKSPAAHCVLTGGEPMIAKGINELADRLHRLGKHITIETAGTIPPGGIKCDLASISPKLSNSKPSAEELSEGWVKRHEETRSQPESLREWIESYDYQLKFVLNAAADLEEMQELLSRVGAPIIPSKVLLMAEGTTSTALRERTTLLLETCKAHGYRFCHRLHIDLFGNTKGT